MSETSLSLNALKVLEKRYLRRDKAGNVLESHSEMFMRVARNIAEQDARYGPGADVEKAAKAFYDLMSGLEFLPNSPTLMNAGRDLQQLSACFVLPVEDSIEGIYTAIKNAAVIHKSGGGTGFSFSRLRPHNDIVRSTSGVASGPISFMKVFNASTEAIKQGGTRRGANMAVLRVDHPDILEFITCKAGDKDLTNFNLSVAVTDVFMSALERGGEYPLIHPNSRETVKTLRARDVFELIVKNAWNNGEPGIIFIDRINRDNPTPALGEIESTNPCGEQPLLPNEACNLGSVNLAVMVKDGKINHAKLRRVVHEAVHFLDNVIDASSFPLPEIDAMVKQNRKIGLGVMGFADMLIQMSLPYNCDEAVETARSVMRFIRDEARAASQRLAAARGAFPSFPESAFKGGQPLRNATTTTIAPTGSISIIAGVSSGIEPLFAITYYRNVLDKERMIEVNPHFQIAAERQGFNSPEIMEDIAAKGSLREIKAVPEEVKRIFVTAHDIEPIWHVRMQAAFQESTDNAVSKTVNLPNGASIKDVDRVYREAYRLGCKGVTIYRDGSREEQVLTTGEPGSKKAAGARISPRKRPLVTAGRTETISTGCGKLYVTINHDDQGLFEVFTQIGKTGGCTAAQSEAVARLISLALRAGVNAESIVKNIRGIRCNKPAMQRGGSVLSCPDAVGIVLERYLKWRSGGAEDLVFSHSLSALDQLSGACPECGDKIEHEGGCLVCRSCGYSKCG